MKNPKLRIAVDLPINASERVIAVDVLTIYSD